MSFQKKDARINIVCIESLDRDSQRKTGTSKEAWIEGLNRDSQRALQKKWDSKEDYMEGPAEIANESSQGTKQ